MGMKIHMALTRMLSIMTACIFSITSCIFIYHEPEEIPEPEPEEIPDPEVFGRVNILYSAGHNNLTSYLLDDMKELAQSCAAIMNHPDDALIIFSHLAGRTGYAPTEPAIIRAKPMKGKVVYDTLMTMPSQTISADARTLNEVLKYINGRFPAKEYNLIFSSHCSGYLPAGYLVNAAKFEREYNAGAASARPARLKAPVAYPAPSQPAGPLTKSIGADYAGSSSSSYEIDLTDFAEAIPMHLNSIIFDACFMGGIEVAYELKDKCSYLIGSQSEILAEGMAYDIMGSRISGSATDLAGLCMDYFNQYMTGSTSSSGATISMIDCSSLEPLAAVCHDIFERHRDTMKGIDYNGIQRFYRTGLGHYHGFYDLRDIMLHAGCSEEETADFDKALAGCVVYRAATEGFLTSYGGFQVISHCGLSMYLPAHKATYGNAYLNDYYKNLAWNRATGLVE